MEARGAHPVPSPGAAALGGSGRWEGSEERRRCSAAAAAADAMPRMIMPCRAWPCHARLAWSGVARGSEGGRGAVADLAPGSGWGAWPREGRRTADKRASRD
eukprot:scaffold6400_cov376-Prasinococcus_capsulatus_cf.AAC.1